MTIRTAPTTQAPSEMELRNRALARRAAAEGFVLLENDGTLPLKEKKIALYGAGARMTVKGGTGSGAVRERCSVSIEQGLLNAGFTVTTTGWLDRFDRFYADAYEAYRQAQEEKVQGLRNEWGYQGTVISDWDSMKCARGEPAKPLSGDVQKAPAAQCDLVMPGCPDQIEALQAGLADGSVRPEDLRRSAARVLKLIRANTALPLQEDQR